jgi:hypothetical protein
MARYSLHEDIESDYEDAEDAYALIRRECSSLIAAMQTQLDAVLARTQAGEEQTADLQNKCTFLLAKNTELESKVGYLQSELRSVRPAPLPSASPSHPAPAEVSTLVASKVEIAMQAFTESIEFELELTARERAARELVVRMNENATLPECPILSHDLGLPLHAIEQIRRGKQPQHGKVFWTITFSSRAFRDDAFFKRDSHFKRLELDLRASNTRRQRVQRRKLQSIEEVLSHYVCNWTWTPSGILLTLTHGNPVLLKDADQAAQLMRQMNFAPKGLPGSPRRQTQAQAQRQADRGTREAQLPERTHFPVRQTADPPTQPPGVPLPMDADLPPHMAGPTEPTGPPSGMDLSPARALRPQPVIAAVGASGSGVGSGSGRERTPTPGRGRGGRAPTPGGRGGRGRTPTPGRGRGDVQQDRSAHTFRPYPTRARR